LNGQGSQLGGRNVPQEQRFSVAHLHPKHLVEIAVINLTAPTDAQGGAAHEIGDREEVETVGQQFQVIIPFAAPAKVLGETTNRLVGNDVEGSKLDTVPPAEFGLVVRLQLGLGWRKFWAGGVIDCLLYTSRCV